MPRRSRTNWPLVVSIVLCLLLFGLYITWPQLARMSWTWDSPGTADLSANAPSQIRQRGMATVAGVWFFVFGATIGSFLNVVAYRMPMGLTIVSKPSRCPYCMTPIKFKHNVPIFGWLALRARCAACRLPISARYVLVEILVGTMFFTLFVSELASGGRNLPVRTPNSKPGVMWNLFTPQWDLIAIYFFHAFLLGVLVTIALIKFDRLRIPLRLVWFAVTFGIIARACWPFLVVTPFEVAAVAWPFSVEFLHVAIDALAGGSIGLSVQALISVAGKHRYSRNPSGGFTITLISAVFLGWQAVAPLLIIASLFQLVITIWGRNSSRDTTRFWAGSLLLGAWLTLCFWRHLPSVWLPGAEQRMGIQLAGLAFGLATAFVAESLSRQVDVDDDAPSIEQPMVLD